MYEVDELYELIREELEDYVFFKEYTNIDDFSDALLDCEDGIKEDVLYNNDFNWYGESGRKELIAGMCYIGHTYQNLAQAITDENVAIDIIFTSIYDTVCNEFVKKFVEYLQKKKKTTF